MLYEILQLAHEISRSEAKVPEVFSKKVFRKASKIYTQVAVMRKCSVKKVFLRILQKSQKDTCAVVFFNKVASKDYKIIRKRL